MFYELVSYNQRLHKKSMIKSSRWQGSLLIRWLQRHIMVFFVICSAVSELWRSPLSVNFIVDITKPDGERVETDCCIKMSIHSTAFLMAVMVMVWIQSHAKELLVHSPNHEKIPSEERELDVKPIMSSFASMNSKFFFTVDEILEWEHSLCA